jgi:hypothetical protein
MLNKKVQIEFTYAKAMDELSEIKLYSIGTT